MTTGLTKPTEDNGATEHEWTLQVNDHVRLRDERADVYTLVYGGAEGWVRDRRIDRLGDFPMVYIQWDQEHWTYNGQPDMWTYEVHFDKIEDEDQTMSEPSNDDVRTALDVLSKRLLGESPSEQQSEGERRAEAVTPEDHQQFERVLERAIAMVKDSDAFLIACVSKEDTPGDSPLKFALTPAVFSYALSPESAVLIDAQLSEIIAQSHQRLAFDQIHRIVESSDDD